MDFLILGPLAVYDHGSEVPINGHKERSLLAMLSLEDGRLASADRLVDELRGDQPPLTARSSLQVRIAGLRRALGKQRIISEGRGYRIHLERGELDVAALPATAPSGRSRAAERGAGTVAGAGVGGLPRPGVGAGSRRPAGGAEAGRRSSGGSRPTWMRDATRRWSPSWRVTCVSTRCESRLRSQLMLALLPERPPGRCAGRLPARRAEHWWSNVGIEPDSAMQRLERRSCDQDPALDGAPSSAAQRSDHGGLRSSEARTEELATLARGTGATRRRGR